MTAPILAAAIFCSAVTLIQAVSILIAAARFRAGSRAVSLKKAYPPVSIIRPLCGIDNYAADTLRSTFALDCAHYEVLFCVATADDPVLPLVQALIAQNPHVDAQILIGDDRVSSNPKLNNVIKGWHAAAYQWIVIADSNVLMPRDYVQR